MKYIKMYEDFKSEPESEPIQEGIFDMIKSATGAFKNFLGGISAPFKNLANDFKKGMKLSEVRNKISAALDQSLKSATDNINKAKDENEINQMKDAFRKEVDELMAGFDKGIKEIKESRLINEGAAKDALIGGRVMFGMLKDTMAKLKKDFDVKYAQAKDLASKKTVAIDEIKAVVTDFKKKIQDETQLKQATEKYKEENKIEGGSGSGDDLIKSYGVEKKEDLVGKEVRYKTKKYDNNKKPEEQKDSIGKLKILKITNDGPMFDGEKEDFVKKWDELLPNDVEKEVDLGKKISDVKDPEVKKKISKFVDWVNKTENKDKMVEIEKVIGK